MSAYRTFSPSYDYDRRTANRFQYSVKVAAKTRRQINPEVRYEVVQARAAMKVLEELQDNWDGYGAPALSKIVRINAWNAFNHFESAGLIPDVSPNASGTISFEWNVEGTIAHCQVGKTRYSMYVTSDDSGTEFFEGQVGELSHDCITSLRRAIRTEGRTISTTNISYADRRGIAS